MYRIEIHHVTAIDKIPVEVLDARIAEWRAFPVWKRIMRRPPLLRIGKKLTVDIEPIDGEYQTIEAASEVAEARAKAHDGEVRPDTTVTWTYSSRSAAGTPVTAAVAETGKAPVCGQSGAVLTAPD